VNSDLGHSRAMPPSRATGTAGFSPAKPGFHGGFGRLKVVLDAQGVRSSTFANGGLGDFLSVKRCVQGSRIANAASVIPEKEKGGDFQPCPFHLPQPIVGLGLATSD